MWFRLVIRTPYAEIYTQPQEVSDKDYVVLKGDIISLLAHERLKHFTVTSEEGHVLLMMPDLVRQSTFEFVTWG